MVNVTNYCLHSEFIELSGLEGPILHTRKYSLPPSLWKQAGLLPCYCVFLFFLNRFTVFSES